MIVSFITSLEVTNAMWRKAGVNDDLRRRSERRYTALERDWVVVTEYAAALEESLRVIRRHRLRASDAIQLACAIIAAPERQLTFVTLDTDLKAAARADGFPVLP